jgi:predicted nucleotidyltransferase
MMSAVMSAVRQHHKTLSEEYGVRRLGVFGSAAREELRPGSDVDLLVEFSRSPALFKFIELQTFLESVFQRKIDAVTENALKPTIKKKILRDVVYV